jgi:hypothetical protein
LLPGFLFVLYLKTLSTMDNSVANCILSTAYWGPVQYFTKFLLFNNIYIEQFETYPKQTYRNRCTVYGPNGVQSLQVPVEDGSFHKILTKDIKIAYHTAWQKNHFSTFQISYKSSPFFEFYIDDIYPFYHKKFTYLIDFNYEITELCFKWLKINNMASFTSRFDKVFDGVDFRTTIHPKIQKQVEDNFFVPVPYQQVFSDRYGFQPNLSILDLMMNCGPEAKLILTKSTGD